MPVEQVAPELERIVSPDQEVEELGTGYGGESVAEGPLWWTEGGYLLFSDIGNNRRLRWSRGEGVTVFFEPTNNATGLTRDTSGRLNPSWYSARDTAGARRKHHHRGQPVIMVLRGPLPQGVPEIRVYNGLDFILARGIP